MTAISVCRSIHDVDYAACRVMVQTASDSSQIEAEVLRAEIGIVAARCDGYCHYAHGHETQMVQGVVAIFTLRRAAAFTQAAW